jgi:hypothetical protein
MLTLNRSLLNTEYTLRKVLWRILPESRYMTSTPTAQKTQYYYWLAPTAQKTFHAAAIVVWRLSQRCVYLCVA